MVSAGSSCGIASIANSMGIETVQDCNLSVGDYWSLMINVVLYLLL